MKLWQRIVSVGALFWVIASPVLAKPLFVQLKLDQIKAEITSESDGDELYFGITMFSNKHAPTIERVPMFPTHWLSRQLEQVRNVTLWERPIDDGETVQLIVSLVEHDVPPWNSDDLIGAVKVTFTNQKGKLDTLWSKPDFKDQPKTERLDKPEPTFSMFGEQSHYDVAFKVVQSETARKSAVSPNYDPEHTVYED